MFGGGMMMEGGETFARPYHNPPCPDDFEQRFIELGRALCEEHYRARRTTINRWIEQRGADRLIQLRRAHIRQRDTQARVRRIAAGKIRLEKGSSISPGQVVIAAQYICRVKGWKPANIRYTATRAWVYPGRAASIIAMAVQLGFQTNLQPASKGKVGSAR